MHINTIEDAKESLKLPFTVYRQEFDRYYVADVRRGGMGIFFSGLFVISIFLILLRVSKYKKNKLTDQLTIALILFGTNIIEMIILPKTSELRYVPHIYLSIVLAMVILYKMNLKGIWFKIRTFLNFFLIIIITLNVLPWVIIGLNRIKAGVRTTTIFENMAYECVENEKIFEVRYCNDTYNGLDYNLNDFDIRYYYNIDAEIDESFKQNYLILYK